MPIVRSGSPGCSWESRLAVCTSPTRSCTRPSLAGCAGRPIAIAGSVATVLNRELLRAQNWDRGPLMSLLVERKYRCEWAIKIINREELALRKLQR